MKKLLLLAMASLAMGACTQSGPKIAAEAPFKADTTLSAAEKKARLFTPEVMLKMGRLGGSKLSPDGTQILYTVTYFSVADNRSYNAISVMNADGSEATQITPYDYKVSEPRWSKDGSKIYFTSATSGSNQVHSIAPDGSDFAQITTVEGGVKGFGISPTENHVWLAVEAQVENVKSSALYPDLSKSNALVYDDLMCRHWDVWEDGSFSHIFVGEIKNGKVTSIQDAMTNEPWDAPTAPYYSNGEVSWNVDGTAVAYTCRKLTGYKYSISTNTDIFLYNVADKTTKNLTQGMLGYDKYPRFSPDGRYMAWLSMSRPGNESDKDRIFVADLKTGEKEYLTEGFDYNASSLTWGADSKTIYFLCPINATVQVGSTMVGTTDVKLITKGRHDYVSLSVAGDKIIAEKTTLSMANELFAINTTDGSDTQLTFINQRIYDNVDMGAVEKRMVKTTDGKDMLTWVITPPKAKLDGTQKYPTLLYCQGGPQSMVSQSWSYRWNYQIMAAEGYVIVAPNRRGLPGFGQEWLDQISGDYSGQNIKDYFSAIDDVAKEEYVDTDNMGCVGASYGGYSAFYIAGHHNGRFKAFISHCGIFDFTSMYGSTEELWFVNNDYGGPYWDFSNKIAQRSYANSPHNFVQNWDTPILIITGLKDYRIPYTQSLEAFTGARARGVDARLVAFQDEAHQVFGAQNAIVWNKEFFGWLNKYLKK